jgi:hypothetical protein
LLKLKMLCDRFLFRTRAPSPIGFSNISTKNGIIRSSKTLNQASSTSWQRKLSPNTELEKPSRSITSLTSSNLRIAEHPILTPSAGLFSYRAAAPVQAGEDWFAKLRLCGVTPRELCSHLFQRARPNALPRMPSLARLDALDRRALYVFREGSRTRNGARRHALQPG